MSRGIWRSADTPASTTAATATRTVTGRLIAARDRLMPGTARRRRDHAWRDASSGTVGGADGCLDSIGPAGRKCTRPRLLDGFDDEPLRLRVVEPGARLRAVDGRLAEHLRNAPCLVDRHLKRVDPHRGG